MSFGINLTGIKELENALKVIDKQLTQDVGDEIKASSLAIMSSAKRLAPINLGFLRGQISYEPINDLTYEVQAKASYSAYVEFGTGGKVKIPAGFEELAGSFKGKKGGKFEDMVEALMKWGLAKGYIKAGEGAKKHAFYMAIKILKRGLTPQPFLIPSYEMEKPKLIQRLKKLLNVKS